MLVPWEFASFVMSQDTKPSHPTEAICHLQTYLAWHQTSLTLHRPKPDVIMHKETVFVFQMSSVWLQMGVNMNMTLSQTCTHTDTQTQEPTCTDILNVLFLHQLYEVDIKWYFRFSHHTCISTWFKSQMLSVSFVRDNPHEKYLSTRLM